MSHAKLLTGTISVRKGSMRTAAISPHFAEETGAQKGPVVCQWYDTLQVDRIVLDGGSHPFVYLERT